VASVQGVVGKRALAMSIRRDKRNESWFFRKMVRLPDGRRVRIFGVPQTFGLPQTRIGAEEAERREVERVIGTGVVKIVPVEVKEVPTVKTFEEKFMEVSKLTNKPAEIYAKEATLKNHLIPAFGDLRLDEVNYARIEDFKLSQVAKGLSRKTVNNHLGVLRRMLSVARKRGEIEVVPAFEWLKAPPPAFDFLNYEEADKLIAAADDDWRAMITLAVRTGLRQSELRELRWEDVDLKAGKLVVRRSVWRGIVTTPKNGKPREVPLSGQALAALKGHRHLRGPLVFCNMDGRQFSHNQVKNPLWRACKRAGLRLVQWHVLRHTFASHLAMRGAPLKVVQELLGHATIQMTMRYAHLYPQVAREHVMLLDATPDPHGSPVAAGSETIRK
jgi:integrase